MRDNEATQILTSVRVGKRLRCTEGKARVNTARDDEKGNKSYDRMRNDLIPNNDDEREKKRHRITYIVPKARQRAYGDVLKIIVAIFGADCWRARH